MSGREWKSGDVAMSNYGRVFNVGPGWIFDDHWTDSVTESPTNLRPLVVIDPEDKSEDNGVSRLCELIGKHHGARGAVDLGLDWLSLQAALREFADPTPPKPACTAVLHIGSERIECERDDDNHSSDHRNDSIGQGVRWSQ